MAHIRVIEESEAAGELAAAYAALRARPMPLVYRPAHGGPPGIHRAHSLDPALLAVTFAATGTMHPGDELTWAEREFIATSASRVNQCLY